MDWMQLLTTFGAPMFVLVALGLGAWRAIGWVGRELIIPARDKLFARVDSFCTRVEDTLDKQAGAIGLLAERLPVAGAQQQQPKAP